MSANTAETKKPERSPQSVHAGINARLIGAFMLGALGLIVVVFLVFGSGDFFKDKTKYAIYFRGSVDGLNTGAPVKIRGVQIGSVTEINPMMHENGDFLVEVIIETIGGTIREAMSEGVLKKKVNGIEDMVVRGLRAQLQSQSFVVSQKMIVVDYYPGTPAVYAGINKKYKEIPSIPTKSEELEQSLQSIVKEVGQIPFADIGKTMQHTLGGVDTFFWKLQLDPLLANINTNVNSIGALANRMDTIGTKISEGVNSTTSAATTSLGEFNQLVKRLENLSTENQYLIKETLQELISTSKSMRNLIDYLQQHPSDILYGK